MTVRKDFADLISWTGNFLAHACDITLKYTRYTVYVRTIIILEVQEVRMHCGYRIAGNFRGMAREPSEEIFTVVIFAVQCQETTPTTSFACEIPVRGSFSQLVVSSALER